MERLGIISFALDLYNDTMSVKKINDDLSEVKIGISLTLTLPNEYFAVEVDDGTYTCVVEDGKLHLTIVEEKNRRK